MLSFTKYLYTNRVNIPVTPEEIAILLPSWIVTLQETLLKLFDHKLLSVRVFTICHRAFEEWQHNPTHYIKQYDTVVSIDQLYYKMLFFISNDISFSHRKLSLLGGYPFPSRVSGVNLEIRLVMSSDKDTYHFEQRQQSSSVIGSKSENDNIKKRVKTRIGKIPWIQNSMKHFGFLMSDLPLEQPHAELIWCIDHSEDLINHLIQNPHFKKLPRLNDDFPFEQLTQTPRLEIITSSSCCDKCRRLFMGLRWTLEQMNINLPIILYANSPYNDTKNHLEMQGSTYVIKSTVEFFNTQVQCNIPKCVYPSQEKIPVEMRLHNKLSTKQEIDYHCLLYLGGVALMDLIAHGIHEENGHNLNPMTYIAPDTLILYAAALLPYHKEVNQEQREAIQYLAKTIEQMDIRLLVSWRMTFNNQLHWLLISHLDPKFKEHAYKSLAATNVSFITENTTREDTDAHKFYVSFTILWNSVGNITKHYQKMLRYYVGNNHDHMPLGVNVGPLSDNMRARLLPQVYNNNAIKNLKKLSIHKPKPEKKLNNAVVEHAAELNGDCIPSK